MKRNKKKMLIMVSLATVFFSLNTLADGKKMDQSLYIHGADEYQEQERLEQQSPLIKKFIWQGISLKNIKLAHELPFLEVGCGVAAQTIGLLDALPDDAHVIGIDIDPYQIAKAKEKMNIYSKYKNRYSFKVMDAVHMGFSANSLSGAYVSWVLEHMSPDKAVQLLKNLKSAVKNQGIIIINETHMDPDKSLKIGKRDDRDTYPPYTKKIIQAMIKTQASLGGNANFGEEENMRLVLSKVPFNNVKFTKKIVHFENSSPDFKAFAQLAVDLFEGVLPLLIKSGEFDAKDFGKVREEIMTSPFIHWEFGQAIISIDK